MQKDTIAVIPRHVGIIMDGNGRWASARGHKRSFGHKHGVKNILPVAKTLFESGFFHYAKGKRNGAKPLIRQPFPSGRLGFETVQIKMCCTVAVVYGFVKIVNVHTVSPFFCCQTEQLLL